MKKVQQTKTKKEHKFISLVEPINKKMIGEDRWYVAKKIIIYCEHCGQVTYQKVDEYL